MDLGPRDDDATIERSSSGSRVGLLVIPLFGLIEMVLVPGCFKAISKSFSSGKFWRPFVVGWTEGELAGAIDLGLRIDGAAFESVSVSMAALIMIPSLKVQPYVRFGAG